jgi:PKD repeat protein
MKIRKITFLMLAGLFFVPIVTAVESEIIRDGSGDVYNLSLLDYEGEFAYVSEHPDIEVNNIDIKEGRYRKEGVNVTLELEVFGKIENRGKPMDTELFEFTMMDTVEYGFDLNTSLGTYSITYVNETCKISGKKEANLTKGKDFYIRNENTLVILFELSDENETYVNMSIHSLFIKMNFSLAELLDSPEDFEDYEKLFVFLTDTAPNLPLEAVVDVKPTGYIGETIQFNGTALFGDPPYTYRWEFGDGKSSTERNPTHIYSKEGKYNYTFTVTDSSDKSTTYTGTIEISSRPVEAEVNVPEWGKVGQNITFNGTAKYGIPPYTYRWDFGDGEFSDEKDPIHNYSEPGEYRYILTVTDSSGETASAWGKIKISSTEKDTPGFELLFAILAIGIIILLKRKKS